MSLRTLCTVCDDIGAFIIRPCDLIGAAKTVHLRLIHMNPSVEDFQQSRDAHGCERCDTQRC